MNNIRALVQPRSLGLSLSASLRRVPAVLLAVLFTTTLLACGDGGGSTEQPSKEEITTDTPKPTPEPTPDVQTQKGEELTVEEYAAAMEEITAAREEEIEGAAEGIMSGSLLSRETVERVTALETNESWSREDAEFASEFAETMLEATTGLYGALLEIIGDSIDEVSGLEPPEHLSDLHDDFIATSREILQLTQDFVDTARDTDTNIGNRDELADFMEAVNSVESGPSDPELQERAEGACLELEGRLEAELDRDVSICGN